MLTKATPSGLAIRPRRIRSAYRAQSGCTDDGRPKRVAGTRPTRRPLPVRCLMYWNCIQHSETSWNHGGMSAPGSAPRGAGRCWRSRSSRRCARTSSSTASRSSSRRWTPNAAPTWRRPACCRRCPASAWCVTLIAWGYLVDRVGERFVLAVGSALTAAAAFAAASMDSLVGRRRLPVPRRHGRGQQQLRQWPTGGRLVPARAARVGDGDPADRPAAGNRPGRLGDSPPGRDHGVRWRCCFPPSCARWRRSSCAIGIIDPPRPPRAEADPTIWPTRTAARRCCGASTRCRCCWWSRSAGVDVHAGVADDRPWLVRGVGGRAGDHRPVARRGRPDRGRTLVRPGGLAAATRSA